MGKLEHQATPFSIAEMNYLIQSDFLDVHEPRGLVTLLLVLLATTLNVRIGEETRNMKLRDFKYVYNNDGTLAYVLYLPDTAKKDQGGKQCCSFALFLYIHSFHFRQNNN